MRNIYTISTKEFQPISYGGNYLHDNYDNLVSFLKIKLKGEKSRLAKPIQKDDNSFDFFGDFKKPLKRISTFEKSRFALTLQKLLFLKHFFHQKNF